MKFKYVSQQVTGERRKDWHVDFLGKYRWHGLIWNARTHPFKPMRFIKDAITKEQS